MNKKRTTIGNISEVYFGYSTKFEVYPQLTADISELYDIASSALQTFKNNRGK